MLIQHIRSRCVQVFKPSSETHCTDSTLNKPYCTNLPNANHDPDYIYYPITHQPKPNSSVMSSSQSPALSSLLSAPNPDYTKTALKFTTPITTAISSNASEEVLEEKLSTSWRTLIDFAAKTSHKSQEPLIEVVKAIQKQRTGKGDDKVTIWGEQVKIWEDMPLFGAKMREAWNRGMCISTRSSLFHTYDAINANYACHPAPNSGSKDDFSAEEWVNLNAFAARLTALSIPAFDFSLYAIWTMRSAFEGNEPTDEAAEAAKVWFLYAGDVIERLSEEGKSFDGMIAKPGEKFREKAWRGFCVERLGVWRAG